MRRGIISTKDWIVPENGVWNFGTVTEPQIVMKTTVDPPVIEDNEVVLQQSPGSLNGPAVSPPEVPTMQSASQSPVTKTTPLQSPSSQGNMLEMIVVEPPRNAAEGTRRERGQQPQVAAEQPVDDSSTEGNAGQCVP